MFVLVTSLCLAFSGANIEYDSFSDKYIQCFNFLFIKRVCYDVYLYLDWI